MREDVQDYYGKQLQSSADLQTNACCDQAPPEHLKPLLARLHDEVVSRYYGCGLVAPEQLQGMRILDLGSGSGRDVYLLSALVGEQGEVVGVDMTDEQLEVARRHQDYHRDAFGYTNSNVRFLKGYIEALDTLDLEDGYFDIVISNCVINLSTDKAKVLRDVKRLLKPGGAFVTSTACLGDGMAFLGLIKPVMRLFRSWPDFQIFKETRLTEELRTSGFTIEYRFKPSNSPTVFLIARKAAD